MKKVLFILALAFICSSFYFNYSIKNDDTKTTLYLVKNRAAADGEVVVGPLCAHISMNVCFVDFTDGWTVFGERSSE